MKNPTDKNFEKCAELCLSMQPFPLPPCFVFSINERQGKDEKYCPEIIYKTDRREVLKMGIALGQSGKEEDADILKVLEVMRV